MDKLTYIGIHCVVHTSSRINICLKTLKGSRVPILHILLHLHSQSLEPLLILVLSSSSPCLLKVLMKFFFGHIGLSPVLEPAYF